MSILTKSATNSHLKDYFHYHRPNQCHLQTSSVGNLCSCPLPGHTGCTMIEGGSNQSIDDQSNAARTQDELCDLSDYFDRKFFQRLI